MESEKKVYLRKLTTDTADLEDYFEITGDERVMIAEGVKPCANYTDSCKRLRKIIDMDKSMAIALKKSDRIVGTITFQADLHRLNKRAILLGYDLAYKHWGKGYMTEAVILALHHAFYELKAMIVSVSHFTINQRSKRVAEKAGFVYEGTLRQEYVRFDNRVFDSALYSITKEEYDQKYIVKHYEDIYT